MICTLLHCKTPFVAACSVQRLGLGVLALVIVHAGFAEIAHPNRHHNCAASGHEADLPRVAIAVYGLARGECGAANFADVFLTPLLGRYLVDVFLFANVIDRDLSPRSQEAGSKPLNMYAWELFEPCVYIAETQEVIDQMIDPVLKITFQQHGDRWGQAGVLNTHTRAHARTHAHTHTHTHTHTHAPGTAGSAERSKPSV